MCNAPRYVPDGRGGSLPAVAPTAPARPTWRVRGFPVVGSQADDAAAIALHAGTMDALRRAWSA